MPGGQTAVVRRVLLGGERVEVAAAAIDDFLADIYRERVTTRGKGSEVWGWGTAYGRPDAPKPTATPGAKSSSSCTTSMSAGSMR